MAKTAPGDTARFTSQTEEATIADPRGRPQTHYIEVSPFAFTVLWLVAIVLHGVCGVYFVGSALFYRKTTPDSYLAQMLHHNKIGMDARFFPIFAIVHGVLAAMHCLLIVRMGYLSIRYGQLSFHNTNQASSYARPSSNVRWVKLLRAAVDFLFGRRGVFGVEGSYFDAQLLVIEVVEIALQSVQAYRMSLHVPRVWLNSLLIGLLVTSCIITPAVHMVFQHRSLARRALSLACDTLLDLVSSVVVPTSLALVYLRQYDPVNGFGMILWSDDIWLMNALNEFQLILVSSWGDFFSRIIVALGFIASFESVKSLVRIRPKSRRTADRKSAANLPIATSADPTSSTTRSGTTIRWLQHTVCGQRLQRILHCALAIWGLTILSIHIYAASLPNAPMCLMQVRPWFGTKPTCAFMHLDCFQQSIAKHTDPDVTKMYEISDETRVVRFMIRHCSNMVIPSQIHRLRSMTHIKIYNTTIVTWSTEAALTTSHHPVLRGLSFVRVNFSNALLPDGLYQPDFPKTISAIFLCVTNLRALPVDLGGKWPKLAFVTLEESQFDHFPRTFFDLHPVQVSFGRNPFKTFPFEALATEGLMFLNLGGNRAISSLFDPTGNTTIAPSLSYVNVIDTNISSLPRWMDSIINKIIGILATGSPIYYPNLAASGTPFCSNLALVINGSLDRFPETPGVSSTELSMVMSMSHKDATTLAAMNLCGLRDPLYYPLSWEDERNGILTTK